MLFQVSVSDLRSLLSLSQDSMWINVPMFKLSKTVTICCMDMPPCTAPDKTAQDTAKYSSTSQPFLSLLWPQIFPLLFCAPSFKCSF